MRLLVQLPIGLVLAMTACASFGEDGLFSGVLADESRVTGVGLKISESLDKAALGSHPIFSADNPVRWLKHDSLARPELPDAFLELRGGDCLPLHSLDTPDNQDAAVLRIPPHLLIVPRRTGSSGHVAAHPPVRVLVRFIKRIVWQSPGSQSYQPSTLFLRNGQQVSFRAAKFSAGMALVLTDESTLRIPLGNIAEMHMPRVSSWKTYYAQLAALSPGLTEPLMQWELVGGTRLTASRLRARSRKPWASPAEKDWAYDIQPAWALDPVQVRGASLYSLQLFSPDEVPLSMIDPLVIHQKSTFSVGWRPRINSNVRGEALASGGKDYLSGFGVPTYSEMHFELPSCVRGVRSLLGLDLAAGTGGCTRGAIHVNDVQTKPLFLSKRLIGSTETVDSGWLALRGPQHNQTRLILLADPASKDRPVGADAFDIRDFVDWLEPRLRLDRAKLQQEIQTHLLRALPGGQSWSASSDDLSSISLSNFWENTAARAGHFQIQIQPGETFLTLRRQLQLGDHDDWLKLYVSRRASVTRSTSQSPARLQVRLDGRAVAELEVPDRQGHGDPEPLLVSAREFRGRNVKIEMVLMPGRNPGWFHWGAIQTGEFPTALREIYSEGPVPGEDNDLDTSQLQVQNQGAYSGTDCLRLEASGQMESLREVNVAIRKHPRPGEFRYLRFVWRKKGGRQLELDLAFQPPQDPATAAFPSQLHHRYHVLATRSLPPGTVATQVSKPVPELWTVVTRDLYEDLGTVQLRSVSLSCLDGEYALADHIFLARSMEDFANCPPANSSKPSELLP